MKYENKHYFVHDFVCYIYRKLITMFLLGNMQRWQLWFKITAVVNTTSRKPSGYVRYRLLGSTKCFVSIVQNDSTSFKTTLSLLLSLSFY